MDMVLDGQSSQSIALAAQALQRGDLIGLPTETVYGLAADACNAQAVAKIFSSKGRPSDHPLIVHVTDIENAERFARDIPDFAKRLMDAYWPGPLTLILPRIADVATTAAGGQNSVGVRCPSHPIASQILLAAQNLGVWGVAAPSANKFGRVSPTTAAHVREEFGDALLVVDGGACDVGIESAIVDCTRGQPVLLRPGVLTLEQLSAACGEKVLLEGEMLTKVLSAPKASGTLAAHYAPTAKLFLMNKQEMEQKLAQRNESSPIAIWSRAPLNVQSQEPFDEKSGISWQQMPSDPVQCAHALFAQLRAFDSLGVNQIWVESPPSSSAWEGVHDRLRRAETAGR
jgi:L-threonylcarbamoyladenylate synthase